MKKVIRFADVTSIVCCGKETSLNGESQGNFTKETEEYVEMNRLTLNTN